MHLDIVTYIFDIFDTYIFIYLGNPQLGRELKIEFETFFL
jgi:hypothetical protein